MKSGKIILGSLLIVFVALFRLLPHPSNFTPVLAMFLFGAGYFRKNYFMAIAIPFAAMFISDFIINNVIYASYFNSVVWFYQGALWNYIAMISVALLGIFMLKNNNIGRIISLSVIASFVFFIISNFGVWASGVMYPKTITGLLACYTAALPFFTNTLLSTIFFSLILFATTWLFEKRYILKNEFNNKK